MNKKNLILVFICAFIIILISVSIFLYYLNHKTILTYDSAISTYNNPIIPEGFKTVDTENAKWVKEDSGAIRDWNKGLVIEDNIGNQFVWIPIDIENLHYNSDYMSEVDIQYKKENLDIKSDEDKQILKYGGFYISRYEAGVPEEMQNNLENISANTNDIIGIPVSRKDSIPWNYISLKNAKQNAESMYQNQKIKSSLPTLKQMEYIMAWLNSCGYNVYEDSSSFGNYSNVTFYFSGYYSKDGGKSYQYAVNKLKDCSMILSTGATDRNMTNNIYDVAGNLWCYTNDYLSISEDEIMGYYCVGGHFGHTGSWFPAYNYSLKNTLALDKVGFRVTLFLK